MTLEEPPLLGPMLAGASGMPADPVGWLFEYKWDGVRAVTRVWDGRVAISSRLGIDRTDGYPELAALGPALGRRAAVLDGEIIAFDEGGRPSFQRLQGRMHVRRPPLALVAEIPVLYVVFDVLWLDGRLLTDEPLVERRRALESLDLRGRNWQVSAVLAEPPDDELLAACRRVGLEGFVGKQSSSPYLVNRRSTAWTKIKCMREREFVVGGWSEGSGGRSGQIGSLAVGWVDPDRPAPAGHPFALRYAGQVGSGLSDLLLRRLGALFGRMAADHGPFVPPPAPPPGLHYVRPELVVEVLFKRVTSSGLLRQPSLKGLRDDVEPPTVGWTSELAEQ